MFDNRFSYTQQAQIPTASKKPSADELAAAHDALVKFPPSGAALGTPEAVARFLDRVGLTPRGINASSNPAGVINLIASRGGFDVHDVDAALMGTTLNAQGRTRCKARLSELGLLK
jgi:hypothetical protein